MAVAWGTFALTIVLLVVCALLLIGASRALKRTKPELPWPLHGLTPSGERSAEFALNMLSIALLHALLLLVLYFLCFVALAGEGVLSIDPGWFNQLSQF